MVDRLDTSEVRIFSGSSHPGLAAGIAHHLNVPLETTRISRFSNDNLYIQLGASVRSRTVFIVQSLGAVAGFFIVRGVKEPNEKSFRYMIAVLMRRRAR